MAEGEIIKSKRAGKKRLAEVKPEKAKEEPKDVKKDPEEKVIPNEYEYDSSDEEDLRNTIGNIPINWYDDEDHIGYDQSGEKIIKAQKKGEIDTFLEKMEDPDYWRKVFDRQSGGEIKLTDAQVERIRNIASGKYPAAGYNPFEPFLDLFSSEKSIHPIDNRPEPKARFIPSKDEIRMVGRMVHAIRMGWAKGPKEKKEEKKVYDLWASEDSEQKTKSELSRMRVHMPAPKMALPEHKESYNPPAEYLFDEEERKKWDETDPEDRPIQFIPQKYDALRKVPQYDKFINERYERCMDLYLAPRQVKMKIHCDPSALLPDLPNPNDLRPFPTTLAFYMRGHEGQVRSISVEPEKGELLVSGGQDGTVRIWMIASGRCIKVFKVDGAVSCVAFCPKADRTMIAVAYEGNEEVRKVFWHTKGDYLGTVSAVDVASSVYIHQLSKAKSQCPFKKRKGFVQTAAFHPTYPQLFVATKIHIRIYDLAKCCLIKKCLTGLKHISSLVPDHAGENLFVGSLDRRFAWMDLQLSNKPWKTFRHHHTAVRATAYHKKYPLLATVSDDGSAMVYYARIHADFSRDNEIYPVKRLYGHKKVNDLCMLDTVWHPTQPWLITAGADGNIALFNY